jgi:hypothetical protein
MSCICLPDHLVLNSDVYILDSNCPIFVKLTVNSVQLDDSGCSLVLTVIGNTDMFVLPTWTKEKH